MLTNRIQTLLRPAKAQDCADIYLVHRHAVRYTCRQAYDETIMNAWLAIMDDDAYANSIMQADKILWVAEYQDKIQGFFQVDLKEARLDALYVHPFVHGFGLGTAMLYRAEELVKQANLSVLSLFASENSISFYELNHYDSLGKAFVPLNDHCKIHCQLMRKFL